MGHARCSVLRRFDYSRPAETPDMMKKRKE